MDIHFNPTQCTSQQFEAIKKEPAKEGFLYFVTDTKQLFLAKNQAFIEMCGGINILYGKKDIPYINNGFDPEPEVTFDRNTDLESSEIPPLPQDLILNKDGCFYRIQSVADNVIKTMRLTLQGTGGGGGSSSGGGSTSASFTVAYQGGDTKYFSAQQKEPAQLGFIAYCEEKTNFIDKIRLSWSADFTQVFFTQNNMAQPFDVPYYVSINKFLPQIVKKNVEIWMQIVDKYGKTREIPYYITLLNLSLNSFEQQFIIAKENTYSYTSVIGGDIEGFSSRKITYKIYKKEKPDEVITFNQDLERLETGNTIKVLDLTDVDHGIYQLEATISGMIGDIFIQGSTIMHQLIIYKTSVGTPIFTADIPSSIQQYVKTTLPLILAYRDSAAYTMEIKLNNELYDTQTIISNAIHDSFAVEFEDPGLYTLTITLTDLGVEYSTVLNVVKYSSDLPVINTHHDGLELFLTAKNQSNSSTTKEIWKNKKNQIQFATLSNFYYGTTNGWLKDENDVDYLKVSQGAQVELPNTMYTPFNSVSGGKTIELDFMIQDITQEDAVLLSCLSYDSTDETLAKITTGFMIQGNEFKYYANGKVCTSLNLVPNKRIRLTILLDSSTTKQPMCYCYLNGIISSVIPQVGLSFINAIKAAALKIGALGGTINIYNIRIYNIGLDEAMILNNYQASLNSLEERELSYNENKVGINLADIEAKTYKLKIPYVKIYGGYKANKDFSMADKDLQSIDIPSLPTGKKDFKAIDIDIIYPTVEQNPYFKDYKNFSVKTSFENSKLNVTNGFGEMPITGAIMYAQGTTSMDYPVKNLRVKLKNAKFTVRPDIAPVELVTFKADYMESSGSHNTGAANYIDAAYASVNLKTPGQEQFENEENGTIVTCIKGHPCLIFWNPGVDENGEVLNKEDPTNYQFIGKYNFNLDKATPEPFGFFEGHDIHCFEVLDNVVRVCNFKSDVESSYEGYSVEGSQNFDTYTKNELSEQKRYYNTWYEKRVNKEGDIVWGWMRGFESRFPEDKEGKTDADVLFPLAKWLNELYILKEIDKNVDAANERFQQEYLRYFNHDFLMAYYVITEALLMIDSRVKNLMLATWGEKSEWVENDENGEPQTHQSHIWYPIFYDMDTMLGLDNIGYKTKNYYDEDKTAGVYNGDCLLWDFIRDNLQEQIKEFYNNLEDQDFLIADNILPYFNANQANLAAEVFYNNDAKYKYVQPYKDNFFVAIESRLYAAQGNRSLDREAFLNNRLRYLSGKYQSNTFLNRRLKFRFSSFKDDAGNTNIDKLTEDSMKVVPPSGKFNITAISKGYAKISIGQQVTQLTEFKEKNQTLTLNTGDIINASGSESYVYGIENLSDVGDLSDKYLYGLSTQVDGKPLDLKLKALRFGNYHPNYYNQKWTESKESLAVDSCRLLEEFNFVNCSLAAPVSMGSCSQLKTVLATGSAITGITLPVGGIIEELRLPPTVTDLKISNHPKLTREKFTLGQHVATITTPNSNIPSVWTLDKVEYFDDFSSLQSICLINTLNEDSYDIVKDIVMSSTNKLTHYCFQGIDWELTDDATNFIYNGDKINGIAVLDKLKVLSGYPDIDPKQLITGKITLKNISKPVQEYDIYSKYHNLYPNLEIVYDNVVKEEAITINFYNTDNITSLLKPYYTVLSNKNYTLAELTSADGPNKLALTSPMKISTETENYYFEDRWVDNDNNIYLSNVGKYSTIQNVGSLPENPQESVVYKFDDKTYTLIDGNLIEVYHFEVFTPTTNLTLIPVFRNEERTYTVTFYTVDGNTIKKQLDDYKYRDRISKNILAPLYLIHPNESALPLDEKYSFKGWINKEDFTKINLNSQYVPTEVIDPLTKEIVTDMELYPYHTRESVNVPTDLKYFDIAIHENVYFGTMTLQKTDNDVYIENEENIPLGPHRVISIKEAYRSTIGGKITLPNIDQSGNYITALGVLHYTSQSVLAGSTSEIKQIFFLPNNQYTLIGIGSPNSGFYGCKSLESIHFLEGHNNITHINKYGCAFCSKLTTFPFGNNLQYIGNSAFQNCTSLSNESLSNSIITIGKSAFQDCNNLALSLLPIKLENIYTMTFYGCKNLKINNFGQLASGAQMSNNVEYIGQAAFQGAGQSVTALYLNEPLHTIQSAAFYSFGNQAGLSLKDNLGYFTDITDLSQYFGSTTITREAKI